MREKVRRENVREKLREEKKERKGKWDERDSEGGKLG